MKLVLGVIFAFLSFNSNACSCRNDIDSFYDKAKSAHLITVTSAILKDDYVEVKFDVIENLLNKSKPPESVKVRNNNCSLQLYPGNEYVVFIPKEERFENTVNICTGIYPLNLYKPKDVDKLVEIKEYIKRRE
ncbi:MULTISPECIES: hypothetical protein [unclassified Colwellia]|uniref:hypothetical protein n=1 Tax=unclassified Colwellia TaxID=196834 RepID=UPI0015F4763E|nr:MULTISPECIES: hypothetical protein [unclassified Colwellia]MBA6231333.1 hypothetical protein [Colwellia sp. MB02u-7]MBA6235353.1 hypothetical protein [Colwellia sp. MB02u-11]MBA6297947.1 hypothetical protein [Colwellia sp. MB3u-22]MBA6309229.1 hypothetical protein [Colwellia sp. MB3u-64]